MEPPHPVLKSLCQGFKELRLELEELRVGLGLVALGLDLDGGAGS